MPDFLLNTLLFLTTLLICGLGYLLIQECRPDTSPPCYKCKYYRNKQHYFTAKCGHPINISAATGRPDYSATVQRKHTCKGQQFEPNKEV